MDLNINENLLDNLSSAERNAALSILKEYQEQGNSASYNDLLYADYNEIPVDIETFVDDNNYLGYAWHDENGNSKLFPYWREQLKKIFPDNIHTKINNAIFSGSRGRGKSEIAVLIASYLMYRILCLKNPIEFFHLKPTEKICFAFMNIKLSLAEEIANDKFQKSIKMSPWFLSHGSLTGRSQIWAPPEYIEIIIGSQSSDVIGKPIYYCFFDEIDFIRNQDIEKQKAKAEDMMDTAIGGMKTRFIYKGENPTLLILASSKRSDKSFLEEHTKKKLAQEDETVFISEGSIWEVTPEKFNSKKFKVALGNKFLVSQIIPDDDDLTIWENKGYKIIEVPIDFKPEFLDNIDRALCDYAGIASSELSKYISGVAVRECVNPNRQNPFNADVIEVGDAPDDTAQYYNFFDLDKIPTELKTRPLCIHLDMSVAGDKTGIAGTFIAGKKPTTDDNPAKDLFYRLGFSISIKAPKGRQISFEKNRNFIRWLRQQGFNIKEVTADTFQSYDLIQQLKAEGFNCNILSVDRVDPQSRICLPYQSLKNAIYENRIELYDSKLLINEITELERNVNNGKVDHPPNGSKDAADAVCGSMFTCSKYAEEFAYDYGENYQTMFKVNVDPNETDHQQLLVDFEEELKNLDPVHKRMADTFKQQDNARINFHDGIFMI